MVVQWNPPLANLCSIKHRARRSKRQQAALDGRKDAFPPSKSPVSYSSCGKLGAAVYVQYSSPLILNPSPDNGLICVATVVGPFAIPGLVTRLVLLLQF